MKCVESSMAGTYAVDFGVVKAISHVRKSIAVDILDVIILKAWSFDGSQSCSYGTASVSPAV